MHRTHPRVTGTGFRHYVNTDVRCFFYDCPEAFNITEVSSYCAEPAEGNTDSGFCELTRWPSARHWDKGTGASLEGGGGLFYTRVFLYPECLIMYYWQVQSQISIAFLP